MRAVEGRADQPGSAGEPPSSSDELGRVCATRIASSLRNGIHSISAAIGSLIRASSSTIHIHSDIVRPMLLLRRCRRDSQTALEALAKEVSRLPALPAPGRLARAGRARAPRRVRARGLLGPARAGLRRPRSAVAPARARAGGARGQPHRAHVHRRPLRRLPVRGAGADAASPTSRPRPAATTGSCCATSWITAAVRCAPPGNRPTPAEREQCLPWTVRELRAAGECARACCASGAFAWDAALRLIAARQRCGRAAAAAASALRPRRRAERRALLAARLLPPQPAEHVHRQADRADDRRGAGARARARRGVGVGAELGRGWSRRRRAARTARSR